MRKNYNFQMSEMFVYLWFCHPIPELALIFLFFKLLRELVMQIRYFRVMAKGSDCLG